MPPKLPLTQPSSPRGKDSVETRVQKDTHLGKDTQKDTQIGKDTQKDTQNDTHLESEDTHVGNAAASMSVKTVWSAYLRTDMKDEKG